MSPDAAAEVLVVDDETEVCHLLVDYFAMHGLQARAAMDAAAARETLAVGQAPAPKVAVIDVNMPGEDGLSLARWLRQRHPRMGIVFLTAMSSTVDRVVGLEIGGDDYVAKPFEPRELLARVKSLLRRMATETATEQASEPRTALPVHRVEFGECQLDLDERRLLGSSGEDIAITAAEFDLLSLFARCPNRPLSRDQIMEGAHHRDWNVYDRSIDLRIMRLRRKIERNPDEPQVIKTVRNVGYVFIHRPKA